MGPTFATIVTERIIDVFSLLALMCLTILIYPFPDWVVRSGYIMFAVTLGLFLFLVFFKKCGSKTESLLRSILKPFSERFRSKIEGSTERFFSGILPLKRWHDYITVLILSASIWACYGLVFYFGLLAFHFIKTFHLAWYASLVLLVITTISVAVPSSPGYVGPFHYLCQISLAMFGVPAGPALSYAAVVHALIFLPVLGVGLLFAGYESLRIYDSDIKSKVMDVP